MVGRRRFAENADHIAEEDEQEETDKNVPLPRIAHQPHELVDGASLRRVFQASRKFMKFLHGDRQHIEESHQSPQKRLFIHAGISVRKGVADVLEDRRHKTDAVSTGLLAAQSKQVFEHFLNEELGGMNENVFKCMTGLFAELSKTTVITFREVIGPIEKVVKMQHVDPNEPGPEVLQLFEEIKTILESAIDEQGFKRERISAMRAVAVRVLQRLKLTLVELEYQRQFHRILMGEAASDEEDESDGLGDPSHSESEKKEMQVESQERPPKTNRFIATVSKLRALGVLNRGKMDSKMDGLVPAAPGKSHQDAVQAIVARARMKLKDPESEQKQVPIRGIPLHSMSQWTLRKRASTALQGFVGEPGSAVSQAPKAASKADLLRAFYERKANNGSGATPKDPSPSGFVGLTANLREEPESLDTQGPGANSKDLSPQALQEHASISSKGPRATPRDPSLLMNPFSVEPIGPRKTPSRPSPSSQGPTRMLRPSPVPSEESRNTISRTSQGLQATPTFDTPTPPQTSASAFRGVQKSRVSFSEQGYQDEEDEHDQEQEDEEQEAAIAEKTMRHLHRASIISGIQIDLGSIAREKTKRLTLLEQRYSAWQETFLAFESDPPEGSPALSSESEGSDGDASNSEKSDGEKENSLGPEVEGSPVRCWLCYKQMKSGMSKISSTGSVPRAPRRRCKKHETSVATLSNSTWSLNSMRQRRKKHQTSAMTLSNSTWSLNSTWSQDSESERPSWRKRRLRGPPRPFRPFGTRLPRFPEEASLDEEEVERREPSPPSLPLPALSKHGHGGGETSWGSIAQSLRHRFVEVHEDSVYITGHCRFHHVSSVR